MKQFKSILIAVVFLLIALNIAYFTLNYTREGNALIATNFVKKEATYRFDGVPETFKLSNTSAPDSYRWEFIFEYQSRNSGFGDRKNASLDSVITNHSAKIVMEKGTIMSAVLDDRWDMKNQRFMRPSRMMR